MVAFWLLICHYKAPIHILQLQQSYWANASSSLLQDRKDVVAHESRCCGAAEAQPGGRKQRLPMKTEHERPGETSIIDFKGLSLISVRTSAVNPSPNRHHPPWNDVSARQLRPNAQPFLHHLLIKLHFKWCMTFWSRRKQVVSSPLAPPSGRETFLQGLCVHGLLKICFMLYNCMNLTCVYLFYIYYPLKEFIFLFLFCSL